MLSSVPRLHGGQVPFAIGSAARRAGTVLVLVGLLGSLLASPAQARHQEQADLSRIQDKLDAIAKVLADARADADQVARALVQADRDVTAARSALATAERRYRRARDRRTQAVREALLAKLEVDAQQALIDRRARETYVNGTPSMVLTLLADANTMADLLDRTKLLGEVAKAANQELAGLMEARVEAEAASQRAAAAERSAHEAKAVMHARATELEQIRAARAAAKRTLEREIAVLQIRQGSLRRQSTRILGAIRAEEVARRRAAQAATNRAAASPVPTIFHEDEHNGTGPSAASYQRLTPTAKRLYGLVTRIFDIHAIGGWRPTGSVPGSDHPRGRALDVFVSYPSAQGRASGWRVATWAANNAWALDVKYVIFNGRIWTGSRGWHGYRHPSDPCNCHPTLRHDDHVHISVQR
jgi:septal ring factor EnvC (AmiA/AmiB activator)